MANSLHDKSPMPFGKFKGMAMEDVPAPYLMWLLNYNKCHGALKEYILDNKQVLEKEINEKNHYCG